ncbi:S8 family peptidase [Pontibacillus salipaludis]|uniref:S8 family peptidase n=1 Tax=Pontibacillus salipaludis TaxID=1697394 RepID=UPI0031ED4901
MKQVFLFYVFLITGFFIYIELAEFDTKETIVAIVDTGIDPTHPMLEGHVGKGYDFFNWDGDAMDDHGHGTHIASVVHSVAPNATLLPVKTLGKDGAGIGTSFIGIFYSVVKGADIVNLSMSEVANPFTSWVIRFGERKGVVFVGASGNDGRTDRISFPASLGEVIAVGGYNTYSDHLYENGNRSGDIEFLAPGVLIEGASLGGEVVRKTGTSFAAGSVSGMLAYFKEIQPHMTNDDARFLLQLTSFYEKDGYRVLELDRFLATQ